MRAWKRCGAIPAAKRSTPSCFGSPTAAIPWITKVPDFLAEPHRDRDPNPWRALYLDESVPMAEQAKRAWLEELSSRNRQYVLPLVRPIARLLVVWFQLLKIAAPDLESSTLLHRLLEWGMKGFLSPNANLLVMRHFHLGSEILRFIADNTAEVDVR